MIWSFSRSAAAATPLLKELSNALDSVVNWYSLGVKLGLEDHELSTIEQNYRGDNERCKAKMLGRWLQIAEFPTWQAVADALCLVGEHKVAAKIQAKHCSSSSAGTYVFICFRAENLIIVQYRKVPSVACGHGD